MKSICLLTSIVVIVLLYSFILPLKTHADQHLEEIPKEELPAETIVPSETTVRTTEEVAPTPPKEVVPATTEEVAPTPPKEVVPATTEEVAPTPPKKVVPTTPKKVVPKTTKEVIKTDNTLKTNTSKTEDEIFKKKEEIQKKSNKSRLKSLGRSEKLLQRESFSTDDDDTTKSEIDFNALSNQVKSVGKLVDQEVVYSNAADKKKKEEFIGRIIDKKAIDDAADKEDKENAKKEKEIRDKVKKAKDKAKARKKFADKLKEEREKNKKLKLEEKKKKLKDKQDKLKEQKKKMKDRAKDLRQKEKDQKQMDKNFREMEDETKKGPPPDPNCRSSACKEIKRLRSDLTKDRNQLTKDKNRLGKDMIQFNNDMDEYKKDLREYQKLQDNRKYLEDKKTAELKDARHGVRKQISDLKRRAKWQEQTKGISDKEAKEFRAEMKYLESQLDKANSAVDRQEAKAFKAEAEALGLGDKYDSANKSATKAGGGKYGIPDAASFESLKEEMRERQVVKNMSNSELEEYSNNYGKIVKQLEGIEKEIGSDKVGDEFSVKNLGKFNTDRNKLKEVNKDLKEVTDSDEFKNQRKAWRKANQKVGDAFSKMEAWHKKLESLGDAEPIRKDGNFEEPEDFPGLDEQRRKNSMSFTGPKSLRGEVTKARGKFAKATHGYNDAVENLANTSMNPDSYNKLNKQRQSLEKQLLKDLPAAQADLLGEEVGDYNLDRRNGLPLGEDGKVDRKALADNVAEMTGTQIDLAETSGELNYVNKQLDALKDKKKDLSPREKNQQETLKKRQKTLTKNKEKITISLREKGVSIKEKNGLLTPTATNREAATTWNIARKGLVDFYEKQAAARKKVEQATGRKMDTKSPDAPTPAKKEVAREASTSPEKNLDIPTHGAEKEEGVSKKGLLGTRGGLKPFTSNEIPGSAKSKVKLAELEKSIINADERLVEIDKDIKKETRKEARKSHERSRQSWVREKNKLLAQRKQLQKSVTRKPEKTAEKKKKKTKEQEQSKIVKSPATVEKKEVVKTRTELKKVKKSLKFANEVIADLDKDIKNEKRATARKAHERNRLSWLEERRKLRTQEKSLKKKVETQEKAVTPSAPKPKEKKKRIEVPSYFVDEYRYTQKRSSEINNKITKTEKEIKKEPEGSSVREVLQGMKKRYTAELAENNKKLSKYEDTLASMPKKQRAELLGEEYIDEEETKRKADYELFVLKQVIPALDKNSFSQKTLTTLLLSLAARFGANEAESILDSSLDLLEETGSPTNGVLLANIVFEYISSTYKERREKDGTRLSLLAHSHFLAGVLNDEKIQKTWGISAVDKIDLQQSLTKVAGQLIKQYEEKLKETKKDLNKTLATLGDLLSVYSLPVNNNTKLAQSLNTVIQSIKTLTEKKKLTDPEASYRSGQQLLLGLEQARKYLEGQNKKQSSQRVNESLVKLTSAYADAYKLLAQSSLELAEKSDGKMADSLRENGNKILLAEARMRFREGNHSQALKLARQAEMKSVEGRRLKSKVLVALIDETEKIYPLLTSTEKRTNPLPTLQRERESLLESLTSSENSTQERIAAAIRLARVKESAKKTEEADYVLTKMLTEIPDNPILASEQLRLKLNRPGKGVSETDVEKAVYDIEEPLRLGSITTTLQTLIKEGNIKAATLLAKQLEKANKDRKNDKWINPELTEVVEVQLAFTKIALHRAGEQGKNYDAKLNSLINEAFTKLRADDHLDSKTFKSLWKMLRDMQDEQRKVSSWRGRLGVDVPPAGGFDSIAIKALSLGRMDLAKEALLKQLHWLIHGENRLQSGQKIRGIRRVVSKVKAISKRIEAQSTSQSQREIMQSWLADTGSKVTKQLDGYLTRWANFANGSERTPEQVGEALSVIRALSRINMETKLAQTEPSKRQQLMYEELGKANRELLKQEKLIIKIFEPYGKKITTDSAAKNLLRIALQDLNTARAVRDGLEDLQLDTSKIAKVEASNENYGFLEPKTTRDSRIRELQFNITGASPGRSGKALAAYRKRVGSSRWFPSSREDTFNKEGSLELAESAFGKARGDEWLNLIRSEDRLAYYERRRMQLVKEDPHRTTDERETLFEALLKHDSEVLLAQGVASNAFSELSQSVINLGETNPNRRESERVNSLIDVDRQQRQLSYLEDARKNGRNVQLGIRSLVQLRERSLAGEFDAFVEYTNRPWYRAGPARAYNLVIGMETTQESLEQTAASKISAQLHQALIRASYRKPERLSKVDKLLLTRHGFLENGKYKIPEHVKIITTKVASEFAKTTEEGVLGATDKILNAAKATELVATIVLPGAYAARFGKGFISAMEATGSSWLAARLAGTAGEALVFAGFSRAAQTVINPEQMLRREMWTIEALGKEYFHSLAVLGALKLYGGATAKGIDKYGKSTTISARLTESVIRNGAVLGEAGMLTGLNRLLSGQHITQESYVENLVMIALMRGAHKDSYTGITRIKNKILRRAGYTPAAESAPTRIGQTEETMARYNNWLTTEHIPGRQLMIRFGGSWNKARKAYQEKELSKEDMREIFEFRRRIVDNLANEIVRELGGEVQAFGSENLTSDYDLSFVGQKAEIAVMLFNARIRGRWSKAAGLGGIESGLTLDTNVYTGPRYSDFKGGREDTWYQDIASQTASRKYMNDAAWQRYRELVLAKADASKRPELTKMLDTVELRQREFQKELQDAIDGLTVEQSKSGNTSLELKTSSLNKAEQIRTKAENVLYEKTLLEIVKLMEAYTKAGKSERKKLAQQIRNLQSKALYFAQEAYFSEAAIKHVVMNTQAAGRKVTVESLLSADPPKLKLSMTAAEGRQSFVEQLANMYKELSHDGTSAKLSSKAAKYFIRALDAAKIAGVDLKPFKEIIESTVELNSKRAEIEQVKNILKKKYGSEGGDAYLKQVLEAANKLTAEIVSGKKSGSVDGTLGKLPKPAGLHDLIPEGTPQKDRPGKPSAKVSKPEKTESVAKKPSEAKKPAIETEKRDPNIAKRRTPRNPELMKGQITYLPKLNKYAFKVATKLFFEKFNGDWNRVFKARRENRLLEYERRLLENLEQDILNILKAESKYVSEKLHGQSGPQASAYQIAYFLNHPKFAEIIRRGAEDLIRKVANENDNVAARRYLAHKAAGELKVVLDPTLPALGVFYPKGVVKPDGTISDGKTIYANPFFRDGSAPGGRSRLRTLDDIASTLLHEFVHRMGYNEVRAWWEQHRFLNQVGRDGAAKLESAVDKHGHTTRTGTKDLVEFIRKHGAVSAVRLLERELGLIYEPIYKDVIDWYILTQIQPETFSPIPLPKKSTGSSQKSPTTDSSLSRPESKTAQLDPNSPSTPKRPVPRWKAREKEIEYSQEVLEKLGMSKDDAQFTSVIQLVQNNRTTLEAISIGAYNRAISPARLLKELGTKHSEQEVRDALDNYLDTTVKIKDPARRKQLIDQYLSGEKTARKDALEAENTPGATATIKPDGSIVIRMTGEKSKDTSGESTVDLDGESTRDLPGEKTKEVDPEATRDFDPEATTGAATSSIQLEHRPARHRIVVDELRRQGFSESQAKEIANDLLVNQKLDLKEAINRAKQSKPDDGTTKEKLEGLDIIKLKIRQREAEKQRASNEVDVMYEEALQYLENNFLYSPLVSGARNRGALSDLRRLQVVGLLREGLTPKERIRGDGAYLLAFRLLKVNAESLGINSINLAKYTNFHAPRVNPRAPEGSTRHKALKSLSEQGVTALLAVEALLTQNKSITIEPSEIARRTGISLKEAQQVLDTAYRNLNLEN